MRRCAVGVALACACHGAGNGTSGSTGESSSGGLESTTGATTSTSVADDGSSGLVTSASVADSESTGGASTTSGDESTGTTGGPRACAGELPDHWPDGTDCGAEAELFAHAYDANTVILRQSLCTSFEGPFLYLLFGQDKVLLEDTGAGGIAIGERVYGIIDDWLAANSKDSIELVVVHSHGHGDHVAGDSQFIGQPNTTFVPGTVSGVTEYFGIDDWPTQTVQIDLGGRLIDVIPIPGHQVAHIALVDHGAGLLLTGDTLYPGRLYIEDFPTYVESVHRLVDNVNPDDVCHVLGTHIEMTTTPGVDFDFGADQHPNERALELEWAHLLELADAVDAMGNNPQIETHDDFIVYPL